MKNIWNEKKVIQEEIINKFTPFWILVKKDINED
jgi:hypothetical protein